MKNAVNPVIKSDILRYKKNKLGANLALLGLACGCLNFLILYAQVKNGGYYYTWWIAVDVIYNLFFMLFAFLFSEQVKNYDRSLFPLQLIVGALQIARIFWLPLCGYIGLNPHGLEEGAEMFIDPAIGTGVFLAMLITFALSGVCLIASGVIGFIRSKEVENFSAKVESGEISVDETLKALDEEEERQAANVVAEATVSESEIKLIEEDKNA